MSFLTFYNSSSDESKPRQRKVTEKPKASLPKIQLVKPKNKPKAEQSTKPAPETKPKSASKKR